MFGDFKQKIKSNQKGYHYISYCLSFMCMGAAISALGPLIPYLAQSSSRSEADYSFLFLARALGFVAGGLLVKFIEKKFNFHQILKYSSIFILIFMFCFSNFNNLHIQTLTNFFVSVILSLIMIINNVAVMQIQKNHYQQTWLNFSHAIFSIGGLIGPILVRFFQQHTFSIIGLGFILVSPCYHFLQTPQDHKKIIEKMDHQEAIQQMLNTTHEGIIQKKQAKKEIKQIPMQSQRILCFMFFLYVGIQTTFGGWISPYAVISQVSLKSQATIFTSLFFISVTIFRFLFCFLSMSSSGKLIFLLKGLMISSFVIVFLVQLGYSYVGCVLSSLIFGAFLSSIYALMLSTPWQYGYQVNAKQGGLFTLFGSFGEGFLSMVVGFLMSLIDQNVLFYMILLSSIILKYGVEYVLKTFSNTKQQNETQLKTLLIQ